jgi:hypothetical protein
MRLAEFEPAVPASERPQTNALDLAATGINQPLGQSSEYARDGMSLQYLVFIINRIFGVSVSPSCLCSITVVTYAVITSLNTLSNPLNYPPVVLHMAKCH